MQLPPHIERAMTVLLNYGSVEDGSDIKKSAPRDQAESLDRQLSALLDLSLVWNESLNTQINDIRRKQSFLHPIYRLPNELLSKILSYATRASNPTEENWDDYYDDVETISSVARLWKDLLDNCQEVWTVISLSQSPAQIQRALFKSGSRDLHIYCTAPEAESFEPIFELITPHSARWKSLVISGNTEYAALLDGVEAPSLETLRLQFGQHNPLFARSIMFWNGLGCLNSVEIDGVAVPQDATWLKGLRNLRIGKPANPFFGLRHLLGNLRDNTTLIRLHLNRLSLGGIHWHSDDNVVHLPHLNNLELHGMDEATLITIFASIIAPACRKLEIDLEGAHDLLASRVLASWLQNLSVAFLKSDSIALRLGGGLEYIRIQGHGVELTLKAPLQPLSWATAAEEAMKLVGLSWHEVKVLGMAPRHLLRYAEYIHASALNVTTLQTTAYVSAEYDALYSVLAGPRFSRTGLRSWVFRRLDTIEIGSLNYSHHGTDPILIELLKARYGEGARRWERQGLPPPAELKEIITLRTPELEATLREIRRSAYK